MTQDNADKIKTLGFKNKISVERRTTIADIFPKSKRRHGIYLLVFSDGLFYIGRTVNFVQRFAQHKKNHHNIIAFYYRVCPIKKLPDIEEALIHHAQNLGLPLTNVVHVSNILGETDFDLLLPVEEQVQWLKTNQLAKPEYTTVGDADQRQKYKHKYEKFRTYAEFSTVSQLLSSYVKACIPAPQQSQGTFWSLSCLPGTNRNTAPRFACISINSMETFVIGHAKGDTQQLWMFIVISEKVLSENYDDYQFGIHFPTAQIYQSEYKTAGPDQLLIYFDDSQEMGRALTNPLIQPAAKELNLRLMRKGATIQHRFHCLDLADELLFIQLNRGWF